MIKVNLNSLGIQNNVRNLRYIFLGYKISDKNYREINILLNIIGFVIYKTYHISEQKRKSVNVMYIFKKELHLYTQCDKTVRKNGVLNKFLNMM